MTRKSLYNNSIDKFRNFKGKAYERNLKNVRVSLPYRIN